MSKYSTIVLFTDVFPIGGFTENAFIIPEIEVLSKAFERVIIFPSVEKLTTKIELPRLNNVEICREWVDSADNKKRWKKLPYLLHPSTYRLAGKETFCKSIKQVVFAKTMASFIERWMQRKGLRWEDTLFYTFWLDLAANALGLLNNQYKVNLISRAHGHDIYTNRAIPLRYQAIKCAKAIYTASIAGAMRLRADYTTMGTKINTHSLGCTKKYRETTKYHKKEEKQITFISVARVVRGKCVKLNLSMIKALAIARPNTHFHWIHIGDGELMTELKEVVSDTTLPNLTIELRGALDNDIIQKTYANETIDWYLLLSLSEGLPVSICEAMAYGVPVIATEVGGIPEIVDDECGLLLPVDIQSEEFVRGLLPYLDSDIRMEQLRKNAQNRWATKFDASKLREQFVDEISRS